MPKYSALLEACAQKNPHEKEFLQAVEEFLAATYDFAQQDKRYIEAKILTRLLEPERMVLFRVPWQTDTGEVMINRGYRVQMNSALGPYKGGLRFHPSVNLSILKFLAFEQTFKNALTMLPLGSGKGGADFDPKGRSEGEVMRFSQSFMQELYRHIGQFTDIPAGDIGVGAREVGYMFGSYKRLSNRFEGVLTGKGYGWGGSLLRPEATGYGCVYFSIYALAHKKQTLEHKKALVSGSGNVAQYTTEMLLQHGAKVLALSDSSGCIYDKDGIDAEKLAFIKQLKNKERKRIHAYTTRYKHAEFYPEKTPWHIPCDVAYPCATQNELDISDAKKLVKNGCKGVFEGANMPTTQPATKFLQTHKVIFTPGKASNAGGVATSGLEMSQNSQRMTWRKEDVDQQLQNIMKNIHENCIAHGQTKENVDYVKGANVAGFKRIAEAMLAQGIV